MCVVSSERPLCIVLNLCLVTSVEVVFMLIIVRLVQDFNIGTLLKLY